MNSTICIIPARGGSKRLPRKNVLPLAGKPMLAYTIDAAKEARVFDHIVVSSDDEEILELAKELEVDTDRRVRKLADDNARVVEVVEEYLIRKNATEDFENVAVMLPTCPLRNADDVDAAMQLYFREQGERFLIAVTKYAFPPQLAMVIDEETNHLTMLDPETYQTSTRSQSIPPAVHPNGAIYAAPIRAFLEHQTFFAEPMISYEMPAERSIDIDYPYQFEMAKSFIQFADTKPVL